jgi:hypothetical protein
MAAMAGILALLGFAFLRRRAGQRWNLASAYEKNRAGIASLFLCRRFA